MKEGKWERFIQRAGEVATSNRGGEFVKDSQG